MPSDRIAAESVPDRPEGGSSTLLNAVIGAVAGVLLSFVPLSTVLGGVVAGYLERGTNEDGLRVGIIAGFIMFVPFLLLGYLVGTVFVLGGFPGFFGGFLLFGLLIAALYTVGAGMLGGLLGVYLRRELRQERRGSERW
jgi:MFS family permease